MSVGDFLHFQWTARCDFFAPSRLKERSSEPLFCLLFVRTGSDANAKAPSSKRKSASTEPI